MTATAAIAKTASRRPSAVNLMCKIILPDVGSARGRLSAAPHAGNQRPGLSGTR
jgi:hypothetical protein